MTRLSSNWAPTKISSLAESAGFIWSNCSEIILNDSACSECPPLPSTKFWPKRFLSTQIWTETPRLLLYPQISVHQHQKITLSWQGFHMSLFGGFEHHFWGLKMTVIYLFLRWLRGTYSKPCLNPPLKFPSWTIPTARAWRRKVKSWSNAQRTLDVCGVIFGENRNLGILGPAYRDEQMSSVGWSFSILYKSFSIPV